MINKNNRGAIELSVSTIVIIVLAMSMLILGLILVKSIFTGATQSVDILNTKVKGEISALFTSDNSNVVVKLGPDHTAIVPAGTNTFGVAFGSRTLDGSSTNRDRLTYKLTLEGANGNNCISSSVLGPTRTKALFKTTLDQYIKFDQYQADTSFAIIQVVVPTGTTLCSQKVLIDVMDTQTNQQVGGDFFIVQISKSGLFG